MIIHWIIELLNYSLFSWSWNSNICPPDAQNWLIGKDRDAGKDWRQEEEMTDDEMVGWHHWFNGHEFEQAPGVGNGQGSLACCSSRGCKESDTTERLNWVKCQKKWSLKNKCNMVGIMWEHNRSSPIGKKFHERDRNYVKSFSRWNWSVIS